MSSSRTQFGPSVSPVAVLLAAGIGAAFVSDWFVEALQPAMATLGIPSRSRLVVVAIARRTQSRMSSGFQAMLANKGDLRSASS